MSLTKKKTMAVMTGAVVVAAIGGTGVAMATGQSSAPPLVASTGSASAETNDGPDQGPDANPNEPGHQDANEANDAAEGPEDPSDDAGSTSDDGAPDPSQKDGENPNS